MKFDQLEYFVETAKREHIGQAASFLNISPSAISHSITALENELGKTLFVKHGRQIKLTAHGKLLLDKAEFLLAEAERIREELSSDQLKMRGHYRLAATHFLCSTFLTPSWIEIQTEHPNLTATLQSLRSGEVLARASASEIDLGICFCPHSGPNHSQEIIHKGKLLLCFSKNHPFLSKKCVKDLEKYPFITAQAAQGIENCQEHISFKKMNIQPKISNLFDSYDVALSAMKLSTLWTLLPDFLAYSHPDIVDIYSPRDWDADYTIAAIWPKTHLRTQVMDYVIEKVKHAVKKALT